VRKPVPQRFRTILVVDDDADVREATAEVLREAGGKVVVAVDGFDALIKLEKLEGPCLIILDLVMPRIDGFEVLQRLQTHPRASDFSVVVMTARPDPIAAPGVLGVLRKPFDVDQLVALLDTPA
jgi:two-component system, chemotaxis family, chemotaxis protein CheY